MVLETALGLQETGVSFSIVAEAFLSYTQTLSWEFKALSSSFSFFKFFSALQSNLYLLTAAAAATYLQVNVLPSIVI